MEDAPTDQEQNPSQPKRHPRTAKADVSEKQSRSAEHLPDWFAEVMYASFLPTIFDSIGARVNIWRANGRNAFLTECEEAFAAVTASIVEAEGYQITKDGPIYRVVRIRVLTYSRANEAFQAQQEQYNWRGGFLEAAAEAVQLEILKKYGPSPSVSAVRAWIGQLSSADSDAFWEIGRQENVCVLI